MSNNRNPYMSQNMQLNARNMNMRGNCGCQNFTQGQRSAQNDCGCSGETSPAAPNSYAQRSVKNDCGCAGNTGTAPANNYSTNNCGCTGSVNPIMTDSSKQNDCGCAGVSGYAHISEIPTGDRTSLLKYIDEVSFGAYEAALYLDTHSDCQNGMQYFQELNEKRNLALKEYSKLYGPLTLMQAGENCEACWQWINQPWPWEGGNC